MIEPLDPWLGLVPPDKLTKLYARISDLLDQIDKAVGKPLGQGWRYHLAFDSTPRVAFPVVWKEIDLKKIDRCASMLSGPLFTSIEYPWPELSEWRNGAKVPAEGFCEPILQIDMDLISRVARKHFEPGVVQVWMDDQDSVVRFVPASLVQSETLTPVPAEVVDFFSNGVPSTRNTYRGWPDVDPVAPWLVSAFYFEHLGRPIHEYPEVLERFLEDFGWYNLGLPDADLSRFNLIASDLHSELREADALSMHDATSTATHPSEDTEITIFFGRFRSVQDGPFDFFEHVAIPLIDFGNWTFYWGDGTAQLLTSSNEPGAEFLFEWSTS